ncbi:MAG: hypothetical protein ACYCPD_09875 [Acidobacteriaceae bacterium]
MALFPEHRHAPELDCDAIRIRTGAMRLCHPSRCGVVGFSKTASSQEAVTG